MSNEEAPAAAIDFRDAAGELLGRFVWVGTTLMYQGKMDESADVFLRFLQQSKISPILSDYAEMERGARAVLAENMRLRDELDRARGDEMYDEPDVVQATPLAFVDFSSSTETGEKYYTVMDVIDHVRSRGFNSPLLVEIEAWWKAHMIEIEETPT